LWLAYVSLTAACGLTYWMLGMNAFDALCHAFSTLATGGFSTHDASIGYFDSVAIEWACIFFMMAGASNFGLHYPGFRAALAQGLHARHRVPHLSCADRGDGRAGVRAAVPAAGVSVRRHLDAQGLFQLVAYATNTGFRTADPSAWPGFIPMLLVLATFMVSCAGGTGGGVKTVRLVLFVKQAGRELKRLVHPNAEVVIKARRQGRVQ